jgi:hypothetical protein
MTAGTGLLSLGLMISGYKPVFLVAVDNFAAGSAVFGKLGAWSYCRARWLGSCVARTVLC